MNMKKIIKFFAMTYLITWIAWGLRAILTSLDIINANSIIAWLIYGIGSLGPTITAISMIEDKSLKGISNFIFNHNKNTIGYLLFFSILYSSAFYFSSFTIVEGQSIIMAPILFIVMLIIGGGNEELGWRGIVQPELEKKFSTFVSSIIISVPWSLWHLPFWFTKGDSHVGLPFLLFYVSILLLSIMLGAIRKRTNSIFYCAILHAVFNVVSTLIVYEFNIILISGYIIALVSSYIFSHMPEKKKEENEIIEELN